MTRYEKIVNKLFGEGFIRYDEDMIYRIINDLDLSYDQSIDDFRNLVTVFIVDLDRDYYASYEDRRSIKKAMNAKLYSILDEDVVHLFNYCVKVQNHELWGGDEFYKAFALDVKDRNHNDMYLEKPWYVIRCLKCAVYLNHYIHRKIESWTEFEDIRTIISGFGIDEHIYKMFDSMNATDTEKSYARITRDDWIELVIRNRWSDAHDMLNKRIEEYKTYYFKEFGKPYNHCFK